MPIITLKYNGKVYQRKLEKYENRIYIMHSKGVQYWFRKDDYINTNHGWHIVVGPTIPDFLMEGIAEELEKLVAVIK